MLSSDEWLAVVQKRLGTKDCEVLKVSTGKLSGINGFLGDHIQAKVSVAVNKVPKELAFFVKRIPDDDQQHTNFVVSSNVFEKETRLYSKVFKSLPATETPWRPQCYLVKMDLLVLDDLGEEGFKTVGRIDTLDYRHCELLLSSLAKFHAVSIALEQSDPSRKTLYELYPDTLFENMFVTGKDKAFSQWYDGAICTLKHSLDLVPRLKDPKKREQISNVFFQYMQQAHELVKPSKKYRNVICHSDLWVNNILFKYDGDQPMDVRLVDFQLARYAPPALDVMSFLYLSTLRQFRTSNSSKLLSLYHQSLSEELARHGLDVNQLLPWSQFLETCDVYRTFGLIQAPMYHHTDMMPETSIQGALSNQFDDFLLGDRYEMVAAAFRSDEGYRNRMLLELEELIEDIEVKFLSQ